MPAATDAGPGPIPAQPAEPGPPSEPGEPGGPADPDEITLTCAPVIRALLAPQFDEYYSDLEDLYEDELTDDVVLRELADFFSDLLAGSGDDDLVERCAGAIEALCSDERVDAVAKVYDQIVLALSPQTLERARSYFGPSTEELVRRMEAE